MASSGASSLNTALLTLLGSLKSNVCGAASATAVRLVIANRVARWVFIRLGCLMFSFRFGSEQKGNARQHSRAEQGDSQKIHAGHETLFIGHAFDAGHFVHDFFRD